MRIVLVLTCAVILMAGCAKPIKTGKVTEHHFTPGHMIFIMQAYPCGKNRICTHPVPIYVPESYELKLHGKDEDGVEKDQWIETDSQTYGRVTDGDNWPEARNDKQW